MKEEESHEVKARLAVGDPTVMTRPPVLIEHRQVDPREARIEPRTPDHVSNVEHSPVVESWPTIVDAGHPWHPLDARSRQILGPQADQSTACDSNFVRTFRLSDVFTVATR